MIIGRTVVAILSSIAVIALSGCSPESKSEIKLPDIQLSHFTISDVCKAGLSMMYSQPVTVMYSDRADDGNIRISYKREQDRMQFKYRCKLDGENILTFDESLNGARWYGIDSDNSRLTYQETDNHLRIHALMGSSIKEHFFNAHDFYPKVSHESSFSASVDELLETYAKDVVEKHKFLTFKVVNKTTSDPLAYIIVFQTSSKDMLTRPDGAENAQSYGWNISVTNKWKEIFCTHKIRQIMKDESIGMVTGIITDEGMVKHSMAPCFVQH